MTADLSLPSACLNVLWLDYLDAGRKGIKRERLARLNAFVEALTHQPVAIWHNWAKRIAAATFDNRENIPARFPLMKSVLIPALLKGVLAEEAGCARWLSCRRYGCISDSSLPEQLRSPVALLKEAIRMMSRF